MNKSKIILGVTAGIVAVALAIGGTLMYFTHTTATATNKVTLGKVDIDFEEVAEIDGVTVIPDNNGVRNYETILPNMPLVKQPQVYLKDGSSDAYVRVEAAIVVYDEHGNRVDLTGKTKLIELVKAIFDAAESNDSWKLVDELGSYQYGATSAESITTYKGYYYYVEENNLAVATLEGATLADGRLGLGTLFDYARVPNFRAGAVSPDFDLSNWKDYTGYSIDLILKAQAIQADWNEPEGKVVSKKADWPSFFADFD